MPLLLAPLFGIALGAAFAWMARSALARDEGPLLASRTTWLVVAFAGLVYLPIVGYFTVVYTDWGYLYFVPARSIPSAVDLTLVLVGAAAVPAGFAICSRAARGQRLGWVAGIGGAAALIGLVLAGIFESRLGTSATFAQFHGEFGTEPILHATLGRAVLFMWAIGAGGVAWTGHHLRGS